MGCLYLDPGGEGEEFFPIAVKQFFRTISPRLSTGSMNRQLKIFVAAIAASVSSFTTAAQTIDSIALASECPISRGRENYAFSSTHPIRPSGPQRRGRPS